MSDSFERPPAEAAGERLQALHPEVLRPTSDRGRLAALATICSLAGVALGFALAGTLFASIPVAARMGHSPCAAHGLATTPAWLGVGVRPNPGSLKGALVSTVRPGSPAAKSTSLRRGDLILAIDHHPVTTDDDLVYAVRSRVPGAVVDVTIARGTERVVESVRLVPMPPDVWRIEQRNLH
jgi:S1-C subfamily serine protease